MATLIDTNVLLDLFEVGGEWEAWSLEQVAIAREVGPVVINPLIYAEMAAGFDREAELEAALPPTKFTREDLPWQAAFLAGRAFLLYRRSGGAKRSPLPDFYVGAHAAVAGHSLLTRDHARYASYFPTLRIIAPETRP
ncbi:type II toxin-antitoxin system VapC family toxin [Mesorhizobium sp. CAU 1741]|uniref:type II toxin-antitoxin system VapC family toxin n=1 Tax=Mesorhizobium sp. CAU 1741 TaxID=3140366 RepID=UPI00325AAE49